MAWKTLVLVEVAVLVGGRLVVGRQRGVAWVDLLAGKGAFRSYLATAALMAVLLTMADLGAGAQAGGLGGIITLSYLMAGVGVLGPALLAAEDELFGTGAPAGAENTVGAV